MFIINTKLHYKPKSFFHCTPPLTMCTYTYACIVLLFAQEWEYKLISYQSLYAYKMVDYTIASYREG